MCCAWRSIRARGGAVLAGFALAHGQGYSHALQVDADGQHDLDAVAPMLALSQAAPAAMIVGAPVFDRSIPRACQIGRWITHFWVSVELLRLTLVDGMCGFRVYPLAPVMALMARENIGHGMDFDIDILVRLAWRGVAIQQSPVRVTYPEGNTSNFDVWRDNWRISCAHTRLVLTMPLRLASIWRQRRAWRRIRDIGRIWRSAACIGLARLRRALSDAGVARLHDGAGADRLLLLSDRARAAAGIACVPAPRLCRAGPVARPGWRDGWRHFRSFAQKVIETFAAWMDGPSPGKTELTDTAEIDAVARSGRGILMVVSHLGNAELSRAVLDPAHRARIVLLVHTRHAESYNRVLQRFRPDAALNMMQVDEVGPDTILALKDLVDRGFWVAIAGDRTPIHDGQRVSRAPFLGAVAPFPQGPYVMAHLLGCPVYLLFCLREKRRIASISRNSAIASRCRAAAARRRWTRWRPATRRGWKPTACAIRFNGTISSISGRRVPHPRCRHNHDFGECDDQGAVLRSRSHASRVAWKLRALPRAGALRAPG